MDLGTDRYVFGLVKLVSMVCFVGTNSHEAEKCKMHLEQFGCGPRWTGFESYEALIKESRPWLFVIHPWQNTVNDTGENMLPLLR